VNGSPVFLKGLAPVPLSGGRAVLNLIPDVPGTYGITAHYAGVDGKFTGSTDEGELIVQQ
jgi:hypothetical protein